MDRRLIYPGELPQDADILQIERNTLVALANLGSDLLLNTLDPANLTTNNVLVGGFKPTVSGLQVSLAAGRVYSFAQVDATAFGSLTADTRTVLQQGQIDAWSNTFVAPTTAGHSRKDLIQVKLTQVDDGSKVLLYYDSSNPTVPFQGPGGAGSAQNTDRRQSVTVSVKAGTSGTSPAAPTADSGYVPLLVVTTTQGSGTAVVSLASGAPIIGGLTRQHHTGATGSAPKIDLTNEATGNVLPAGYGNVKHDVFTATVGQTDFPLTTAATKVMMVTNCGIECNASADDDEMNYSLQSSNTIVRLGAAPGSGAKIAVLYV